LKKQALAVLMGFMLTPSAFAYTIITEPDVFYSFFEKPKMIIEFAELKDGTAFGSIGDGFKENSYYAAPSDCINPGTDVVHRRDGFDTLAVRTNAFSNAWSFMGADPKEPHAFCEAVIWFDQGISSGIYNMTVVATSGQSQPFVLYTNKGFIGILPDSPQETLFIFDNLDVVYSFETEFSKANPVSEAEESYWAQFEIFA